MINNEDVLEENLKIYYTHTHLHSFYLYLSYIIMDTSYQGETVQLLIGKTDVNTILC